LVRQRLAGCDIPPQREGTIIEELSQDLEQRYADALAQGLSPEDAERGVAQQLDASSLAAEVRLLRTAAVAGPPDPPEPSAPWWTNIGYDLRYAWRALRLSPAFTVAALLSLALGIGANTSIFELLNALRLKTVPIPDAARLVEVRPVDMHAARGAFYTRRPVVTHPQWEEIRDHQKVLDGLFAWYRDTFNVAPAGEARLVEGLEVSGSFFSTLGLHPAAGRLIDAKDDVSGCGTSVAVISHAYWRQQYGGASDVVGRSITLERHVFEIVGVAPASF
jgi:hypothetical protein